MRSVITGVHNDRTAHTSIVRKAPSQILSAEFIKHGDVHIPAKYPYKTPKTTTPATVCTPIIPNRITLQQNVEMMTRIGTRRYPTKAAELTWPMKLDAFMITSCYPIIESDFNELG